MLAGCSNEFSSTGGKNSSPCASPYVCVKITGVAQAGPVNGRVKVYTLLENGERGSLIATQDNVVNGVFEVTIFKDKKPILISATGSYTDEATGLKVDMQGEELTQILPQTMESSHVPVTPATTFVSQIAVEKIRKNKTRKLSTQALVEEAHVEVAALFGVDKETIQAVPASPKSSDLKTQSGKAARLMWALSQAMKDADLSQDKGTNPIQAINQLGKSFTGNPTVQTSSKVQSFKRNWTSLLDQAKHSVGAASTPSTSTPSTSTPSTSTPSTSTPSTSTPSTSTPSTSIAVPDAPTGQTGAAGNGQVTLSWAAPTNTGGAPITDYVIEYFSSSTYWRWTPFNDGVSLTTSAAVTGLANGYEYQFRVAAVNSKGTGSFAKVTVSCTSPNAPTGLTGTPGSGQVTLSWVAPTNTGGSAITDYVIQYRSGSTWNPLNWNTFNHEVSPGTRVVVTGLTGGTEYYFRVAAVNVVGTGGYSSLSGGITTLATVPGAPNGVTGPSGNGPLTVSWSAPNSGGSPITDYVVQYSSDSGTSWNTFNDGVSPSIGTTVTGLAVGTAYIFRLAAVNSLGTGAYSSPSSAYRFHTLPSEPMRLLAVAGDKQVTLTWDAPLTDGGSPVSDYYIEYQKDLSSSWIPISSNQGNQTTTVISKLSNQSRYLFRIAAINSDGIGSFSSPSSGVVPAARVESSAPVGIVAQAGDSLVYLTWNAPADSGKSPITDYTVQYSSDGGSSWINFSDEISKETHALVTGLTNGRNYYFRIRARNSFVPGIFSSSIGPIAPSPFSSKVSTDCAQSDQPFRAYLAPWLQNDTNAPFWIEPDKPAVIKVSWGPNWMNGEMNCVREVWGVPISGNETSSKFQFKILFRSPTMVVLEAPNLPNRGYFSWFARIGLDDRAFPEPSRLKLSDFYLNPKGKPVISKFNGEEVQVAQGVFQTNPIAPAEVDPNKSTMIRFCGLNFSQDTQVFVGNIPCGDVKVFKKACSKFSGIGSQDIVDMVTCVFPGRNPTSSPNCSPKPTEPNPPGSFSAFNSQNYCVTVTSYQSTIVAPVPLKMTASAPAAPTPVGPSAPLAPIDLNIATRVGESIPYLTWMPPPSNGGGSIWGYQVDYKKESETQWRPFDLVIPVWNVDDYYRNEAKPFYQGNNVAIDSVLTLSEPVLFRVAAINAYGLGIFSEPKMASDKPGRLPLQIFDLSGLGGNAVAYISWAPRWIYDDSLNRITEVVVQYSSNNGLSWTTAKNGIFTLSSALITGLTNNTEYMFRVAGINSVGMGPFNSQKVTVTPKLDRSVPQVPIRLESRARDTAVSLSWSPPDYDGGSPITDYVIQFRAYGQTVDGKYQSINSPWQTFADGVSNGTSATVTGLTNDIDYNFKIAAVNAVGQGAFSESVTSKPYLEGVAEIRGVTRQYLSWLFPATDEPIYLYWKPSQYTVKISNGVVYGPYSTPENAVYDFIIQYSVDKGLHWATYENKVGFFNCGSGLTGRADIQAINGGYYWNALGSYSCVSTSINDLDPNLEYIFRVGEVNKWGEVKFSQPSDPIVPFSIAAFKPTFPAPGQAPIYGYLQGIYGNAARGYVCGNQDTKTVKVYADSPKEKSGIFMTEQPLTVSSIFQGRCRTGQTAYSFEIPVSLIKSKMKSRAFGGTYYTEVRHSPTSATLGPWNNHSFIYLYVYVTDQLQNILIGNSGFLLFPPAFDSEALFNLSEHSQYDRSNCDGTLANPTPNFEVARGMQSARLHILAGSSWCPNKVSILQDFRIEYSVDNGVKWYQYVPGQNSQAEIRRWGSIAEVEVEGLNSSYNYLFRVAPINSQGRVLPWLAQSSAPTRNYASVRPFSAADVAKFSALPHSQIFGGELGTMAISPQERYLALRQNCKVSILWGALPTTSVSVAIPLPNQQGQWLFWIKQSGDGQVSSTLESMWVSPSGRALSNNLVTRYDDMVKGLDGEDLGLYQRIGRDLTQLEWIDSNTLTPNPFTEAPVNTSCGGAGR
jgi:hypothetical protein